MRIRTLLMTGSLVAIFIVPAVGRADGDPCDLSTTLLPELCGTTTIHGDAAGRVEVILTTDVVPNATDWVVTGGGDFVGVGFATPAQRALGVASVYGLVGTDDPAGRVLSTLPARLTAGTYSLYLFAEAPGASVTLTFPELSGSADLIPTTATTFSASLPTGITPAEVGNVYAAGGWGEIGSKGMVVNALWQRGTPVVSNYGHCFYNEHAWVGTDLTMPGGAEFAPGCPVLPHSEYLFLFPAVSEGTGGASMIFSDIALQPGRWGSGGWFVVGGTVDSFGSAVLWMGL